jgi:uncharacterized protein (DUF983 family)
MGATSRDGKSRLRGTLSPMDTDTRPPAGRMLGRALVRRCPLCGSPGIFRGWFRLRDRCPGCGYRFEREEGYWVGAMIVNLGFAQVVFMALLIGGAAAMWPDVAWTRLLVLGIAVMAVLPVAFYPLSKTLWLWGDLVVRPPGTADEDAGPRG